MRPTFLGFETSRKAINASQKALDITGNNLANIETKGYTRQRLDLFSMVTTTGTQRYSTRISLAGQGVYIAGVNQIRDPFLDKRYRELNAQASEAGIKTSILRDVEDVLDNIDTDGLQNKLLSFQDSLSAFATDSTNSVELASIVVGAAKTLVSVLNDYDTRLTQIQSQTKFEIDATISDINAIFDKVAVLNKQIVDSYVSMGNVSLSVAADYTVNSSYGPNELLDARNVLLDSLSTYGNLEVTEMGDGSVTVKFAGTTAVEGSKSSQISCNVDTVSGALELLFDNGDSVNKNAAAGSLKGYIDMYNGNGCYAQGVQSGVEGIAYYRSAIDKFAEAFSKAFNDMNVGTGTTSLFVAKGDMAIITAGNIRLSEDWINNPLSILPTDQDGKLDNAHIFKLMSLFDKGVKFGDKQDFEGTFEEYISYFSNKMSGEITYQNGVYSSSNTMSSNILDSRDAVMGVNLDEEGINMMAYQKWFNASSRVMTALDEALNVIINSMGLVGRG